MKKLFLFIILIFGLNLSAQNENKRSARGPIYPGCEEFQDENRELYNCFNIKIIKDLSKFIPSYDMNYDEPKVVVRIMFSILKEGQLVFNVIGNNRQSSKYNALAKKAFIDYAQDMNNKLDKGKGIQPAIDNNNNAVIMEYTIPITFYPPPKTKRQERLEKKKLKRNKK